MVHSQKLYCPLTDPAFAKPYVDIEQLRDQPHRHLYVHGGFEDTKVRFSLYFPPEEAYERRFFHLVTPVQGSEDASQALSGEEDNIGFAITHGAFFIESNMGGDDQDYTMLYRSSAAVAQYSRVVAARLYGEHRPYGYIYGGSGGGYKTTACVQNTEGIWDGSVPFVIGSPMSIPNMFTVRVHAMRLLRDKFPSVIDAVEPGGSGDMFKFLNEEERAALEEAGRMGFPPKAWFSHEQIGAGALPVLTYAIDQMDPTYYTDFWTKPGYLGSDPNGSAVRDRLQFETTVSAVILPKKQYKSSDMGVDGAWQTMATRYESDPAIVLNDVPSNVRYLDGTKLAVQSGAAAGLKLPLGKLDGNKAIIGTAFGMGDVAALISSIKPGDEILLDNSDYIALQTYHRHQMPGAEYPAWDQFRDENGDPIYPQRDVLIGPITACTGAGSVQSGSFSGKMIVIASLLDESALPWQADWYFRKVRETYGDDTGNRFRMWYTDNAMHGGDYDPERSLHIVSYRGALNQALLDVSAWVEKGEMPPDNTVYAIEEAQVIVPESAAERKGIQPVVSLSANGALRVDIAPGESVVFDGAIDLPAGAGRITGVEFDFEGAAKYNGRAESVAMNEAGTSAAITAKHRFDKPGVYFPVLRVSSNRLGDASDIYTQVKNLARVRVVVQG